MYAKKGSTIMVSLVSLDKTNLIRTTMTPLHPQMCLASSSPTDRTHRGPSSLLLTAGDLSPSAILLQVKEIWNMICPPNMELENVFPSHWNAGKGRCMPDNCADCMWRWTPSRCHCPCWEEIIFAPFESDMVDQAHIQILEIDISFFYLFIILYLLYIFFGEDTWYICI